MWLWLWMGCAPKEPYWVEDCDCPNGQICVYGGVAECVEPPPECEAAFAGECDLTALGDPCTAALCGYLLEDSGIGGSFSIAAECWELDGRVERWFDCDAPLTF